MNLLLLSHHHSDQIIESILENNDLLLIYHHYVWLVIEFILATVCSGNWTSDRILHVISLHVWSKMAPISPCGQVTIPAGYLMVKCINGLELILIIVLASEYLSDPLEILGCSSSLVASSLFPLAFRSAILSACLPFCCLVTALCQS